MPKRIPKQELDAILTVVVSHPEGVPASAIRERLARDIPIRTLQRRLALLVDQRLLIAKGQRKGRRYLVPVSESGEGNLAAGSTVVAMYGEVSMAVSPEAEALKKMIRKPIQKRQPVGYQRTFLDDYRPNVTYYLPAETRQRLLDMGSPSDSDVLAGTYARTIYSRLMLDLSWNSSRLEGNTYSLLETERLLELGEAAEGRDVWETQMILNHKAAIELLVDNANDIGFNPYTILNLHAVLADNLLGDPQAGGRLRRIPVRVKGAVFQPLEVPQLIEECFKKILDTAAAIEHPFEKAFFAFVHLAYLQGFEDVNKRVSRLAVNIPLIRNNLCPLTFVSVPGRAYIDGLLAIYELNRVELLRDVFVWAYERSCARYSTVRQSLGTPDPFRLQYRTLVTELVAAVVRMGLDKHAATALVQRRAAAQVSPTDEVRFVEVVETEVMSLHEGNIARYRLKPAEFAAWRQGWS